MNTNYDLYPVIPNNYNEEALTASVQRFQSAKKPRANPYETVRRINEKCATRLGRLEKIREEAIKRAAQACENYIPTSERFEEVKVATDSKEEFSVDKADQISKIERVCSSPLRRSLNTFGRQSNGDLTSYMTVNKV